MTSLQTEKSKVQRLREQLEEVLAERDKERQRRDDVITRLQAKDQEIASLKEQVAHSADALEDAEEKLTYLRGIIEGLQIALGQKRRKS